jgi:putative FmdB family regulatory protein
MPLYEYKCDNCHNQFEIIQKMSDEPLKTCTHCHTDNLKKLMSSGSFILKGGGWYKNGKQ